MRAKSRNLQKIFKQLLLEKPYSRVHWQFWDETRYITSYLYVIRPVSVNFEKSKITLHRPFNEPMKTMNCYGRRTKTIRDSFGFRSAVYSGGTMGDRSLKFKRDNSIKI
ncbi:uncharacterized protein LOC143145408 [Ptiloglossa arizonensis]|uniref:uncharacterized protein LOC143145408 n=1 Tax=Ptiloglossa arizonensis TaxID=3350558 RepID=UPI003F9F83E3